MCTASVIEYFGFHRQILFLRHTGGSRVVQFLQLRDGILDVTQQHVCHVAAESLANNDTHYDIVFQL